MPIYYAEQEISIKNQSDSMGKLGKLKTKILAFLPKAASLVTFLSPPSTPRTANTGKSSPGPIAPLVPKEVRRRARRGSFDTREPASPQVSCVGQVKNHKKKNKKKKNPSILTVLNGKKQGLKSDSSSGRQLVEEKQVPSFGQMKQFSSNRGVLKDFDWKVYDASGMKENLIYCSDDDERNGDEEKVIPVVYSEHEEMDGDITLKPREEVNLWKRRSTARPITLRL